MNYCFNGELFTRKQERGKLDWNKVRIQVFYYVNNSPRRYIVDKPFRNKEKFFIIRSDDVNSGI